MHVQNNNKARYDSAKDNKKQNSSPKSTYTFLK